MNKDKNQQLIEDLGDNHVATSTENPIRKDDYSF